MSQRWHIRSRHELNAFNEYAETQLELNKPFTVEFIKPGRSPQQNTMIYGLYADAAKAIEDKTLHDVKLECKLHYGVPILRSTDPDFCEWYDTNLKPLPYETKLALVERIPVTSKFSKEQATDYINTILSEYAKRGIYLPPPNG